MIKVVTCLIGVLMCLISISCNEDANTLPEPSGPGLPVWLVPQEEVFDAGVGVDGIPSIDNPQFTPAAEIGEIFEDELVLGIEYNGLAKAYPIPILNWHEIVNDEIDDLSIAITYCPLTDTGIGWNRRVGSRSLSFGVSGLLYNTNLMPYDRRTNSIWSQQALQSVNGLLRGTQINTINMVETTFKTWKKAYPNSMILNGNTGFDRAYFIYPYGDYITNDERLLYPIKTTDRRLPLKERVLGVVIDGKVKAYRFNQSGVGMELLSDSFQNSELLVVRSSDDNFIVAFIKPSGSEFTLVENPWPAVIKDDENNFYDLMGRVISGPGTGSRLDQPVAFIGFWFSWESFYPDVEIYGS